MKKRRGVLRVSMSENARLSRGIDAIELGFVEREATSKFAMKLGIQMHLRAYRYRIPSPYSNYWVSSAYVRLCIIGYTKSIYSPTTI